MSTKWYIGYDGLEYPMESNEPSLAISEQKYWRIINDYANRADTTIKNAAFDIFESELGVTVLKNHRVGMSDMIAAAYAYNPKWTEA